MNNATIEIKIKERLNKLSSNDYTNINRWQLVEAFNKGQVDWCRRNLHGINQKQEGDEQSKRRIDDLQILLTSPTLLTLTSKPKYFQAPVPADYFQWKRVSANATKACCKDPRPMVVSLAEDANVDELLRDENKKPSFEFAETFAVLQNNMVLIYTNDDFVISNASIVYYRQPTLIQIQGTVNPYTGVTSVANVNCEFKDDIVELFCDEAAKILAGDMESTIQAQRNSASVEQNN